MSKRISLADEQRYRDLQHKTRRHFLKQCTTGLGALALGGMMGCQKSGEVQGLESQVDDLLRQVPHFAPKAKRIIYLHMAGAPSQLELFDYKPELAKLDGKDCPQSLLEGKSLPLFREYPKCWGLRLFSGPGENPE